MSVCMDGRTLLEDDEYTMIIHALGLTRRGGRGRFGKRWAYRNFYAASDTDAEIWMKLVKREFAKLIQNPGTQRPFHMFAVTRDGMVAADVLRYISKEILRTA